MDSGLWFPPSLRRFERYIKLADTHRLVTACREAMSTRGGGGGDDDDDDDDAAHDRWELQRRSFDRSRPTEGAVGADRSLPVSSVHGAGSVPVSDDAGAPLGTRGTQTGREGDVWDALTNIFTDMDSQGGAGDEQDALAETLEALRGLLDMHLQLQTKTKGLHAKLDEMGRERDAALDRLAELETMEAARRRSPRPGRTPVQRAWGAYADLEVGR